MTPATPDPRDIVTTRRLAATPEQVFAAYSNPARLARWWGPSGFRNTFDHCDFRPGGEWTYTMHAPTGVDYPNRMVFEAIEAPSRIVMRHLGAPAFVLTATLEEEAGGTRITWQQRFETAQLREQLSAICVPANEQNLDRLEGELGLRQA